VTDAFVVSAVRTPVGKAPNGALRFTRPDEMAATVIAEARCGPNHGRARAPFTGLRVVATSNTGLAESSEASRTPGEVRPAAQPPNVRA